jgi:hypothetical protein
MKALLKSLLYSNNKLENIAYKASLMGSLIALCVCFVTPIFAQINMVQNPSFEYINNCDINNNANTPINTPPWQGYRMNNNW